VPRMRGRGEKKAGGSKLLACATTTGPRVCPPPRARLRPPPSRVLPPREGRLLSRVALSEFQESVPHAGALGGGRGER
jgi:hypothetical protein